MSRELSLEEVLRALPPESLALVESIVEQAVRRGVRLYLVGGPVRDLLLGREIRDVDLIAERIGPADDAVGSDGEQVVVGGEGTAPVARSVAAELAEALASEDVRVVEHGRFGTVRIEGPDVTVDVASVRSERYERPGALPSVAPGTLEDDLRRRDFSVNALAIELRGDDRGAQLPVIDGANGLGDLEAGKLRILHDRSFHDDPTRALRAARLAPRLGFGLTRGTRSALRGAIRDGAFGAVSGERLRREIQKCFTDCALGLDPAAALRALADWHVLPALEPGLGMPRESAAPLRRLGRSIADPPWRGGRTRPWISGLALWLGPQPRALRRRTLERFSVRGDQQARIVGFQSSGEKRLGALADARGRGAVDALLSPVDEDELFALHALAAPAVRRRIVRWAAEDRGRRMPIGGADLTAMGLEGPAVGRVLGRVRSAFLDGEVANREEAVALAEELARRKASSPAKAPGKKSSRKKAPRGPGSKKRAPAKKSGSRT
jgi:tRNA nucleotidyltransferase (CCA-adding enzyme)